MTKTWQRQIEDKKMTMWGHYEWWEMRFRWDLPSLFLSWWISLSVTWETEGPWWGGNRLFGASLVAQMVKSHVQCRRPDFDTWIGKIPWRRAWHPTPVFLPREFHGQRSLCGVAQSWTYWATNRGFSSIKVKWNCVMWAWSNAADDGEASAPVNMDDIWLDSWLLLEIDTKANIRSENTKGTVY